MDAVDDYGGTEYPEYPKKFKHGVHREFSVNEIEEEDQ
jgi:hypothetical protein